MEINEYARWRRGALGTATFHEKGGRSEAPPEALLQAIWFHQRLQRDRLCTADGRTVRVLHPGFWNREAGPDFRGAVIQFEGEAPRSGDVEIDTTPADWRGHGHDANPNFQNVLLHVVWRGEDSGTGRPTLGLASVLDAPIDELAWWHGADGARTFPEELTGRCCAPLGELSEDRLRELLRQAAAVRMQGKAAQLHARAREAGWEQALWEGLFRGLGYKRNQWPMLRLAELRQRLQSANTPTPVASVQARLLGIGGLLPAELNRRVTTDRYVRGLWDSWWRERDAFADCAVPRSLWNFAGLRPANHPERRLGLAAHWLTAGELLAKLERWCVSAIAEKELEASLLEAMQVPADDFWSHHWTLRSKSFAKSQPLLGATRVTDLAINVVIPWLWVRAVEGRNERLKLELERRYLTWSAAGDNSVLRLARKRLLGGIRSGKLFRTAAAQQGLLQIVGDFCVHSNALCEECRFPGLVRKWSAP